MAIRNALLLQAAWTKSWLLSVDFGLRLGRWHRTPSCITSTVNALVDFRTPFYLDWLFPISPPTPRHISSLSRPQPTGFRNFWPDFLEYLAYLCLLISPLQWPREFSPCRTRRRMAPLRSCHGRATRCMRYCTYQVFKLTNNAQQVSHLYS